MERRIALKNLSALTAGMLLFPGCGDRLQIAEPIMGSISLNREQRTWIEAISEAILPKNDLDLTTYEDFPDFVIKMIGFDKSEIEKNSFVRGYNQCTVEIQDLFQTKVTEVQPDEIVDYFNSMSRPKETNPNEDMDQTLTQEALRMDQQFFCTQIRQYSITHLKTAKEYQEKVLEYRLVPPPYEPCMTI